MKSTLIMSALVLLFVAAYLVPATMKEPKKTPNKPSKLEVKATGTKVSKPKPLDIEFGLTASFGPKPQQ
ncbi:hypothetical protein H7Y21_01700 [Arenimonas sp.]|nr:hypothetical protein [Candidatus Parcubacteria bacterium]